MRDIFALASGVNEVHIVAGGVRHTRGFQAAAEEEPSASYWRKASMAVPYWRPAKGRGPWR